MALHVLPHGRFSGRVPAGMSVCWGLETSQVSGTVATNELMEVLDAPFEYVVRSSHVTWEMTISVTVVGRAVTGHGSRDVTVLVV